MKRILTTLLVIVGLMGLVTTNSYTQSAITTTTLSVAMADARTTTMTVASATGFTASSFPGNVYYAYIDHEAMLIRTVSGTTITVDRGQLGTTATAHVNASLVFAGAASSSMYSNNGQTFVTGGPFVASSPYGSCTRAGNSTLPLINTSTGQFSNCLGGQWRQQVNPADQPVITPGTVAKYCTVPIGSVAYGSMGNSTTFVSGTVYVGSVYVPYTFLATGANFLTNGTVGTDNALMSLYDSNGVLLANSAVAGAVTSGANTMNARNFTATQLVTGPARYFLGLQANGATDGFRSVATVTFITLAGNSRTGTFGTLPNITVPTALTANTAPIGCIY